MWPDALDRLIAHARRRLALAALATGLSIGTAIGLLALVPTWFGYLSRRTGLISAAALTGAAIIIAFWRARRPRRVVAAIVERRASEFRNLLITSVELADHPDRAQPALRTLVWEDASRVADRVQLREVLPLGRSLTLAVAGVLLWIVSGMVLLRAWPASPAVAIASGHGDPSVSDVTVRVAPPSYSGLPATSSRNADHIDVLAGSELTLTVDGHAAAMTIANDAGRVQPLAAEAPGRFSGTVAPTTDGYLAIEPRSADGVAGTRRLVTVTVRPDLPPVVKVTSPAKDSYVADTSRSIDVEIAADDDFGVRSLKLIYTKVSGSGENFTFADGEAPVQLTRNSDRSWTGKGTLALATLALEKGDTLVYRATAVDSLPGRAPVESDAYIVQVLSPSDVAMEGFVTGDDREKYALSEQMIVVKTEQLHAKRGAMSSEAVSDEAVGLSAMQRSVRAEFVFMLGGELEDIEAESAAAVSATELHEEAEAQGEQDLLAGRMANQGRQDVLIAIRRMSEAATSLAVADTAAALVAERAAVQALQRAFTKSRLILRTLSVRERIDPARRLIGDTKGQAPWRRPPGDALEPPRLASLRRGLDRLADLSAHASFSPTDRALLAELAEDVLRVEPGSATVRAVAAKVVAAADAVGAGRDPERVRGLIEGASVALSALARDALREPPQPPLDPAAAAMSGALTDRLRRAGGGRP